MTETVTRLPRRNARPDELWQRQGQRGRDCLMLLGEG